MKKLLIFAFFVAIIPLLFFEAGAQDAGSAPTLPYTAITITGSATENHRDVPMTPVCPTGTSTGTFVAYLRLIPGTFTLLADAPGHTPVKLGLRDNTLTPEGSPCTITDSCIVQITADTRNSRLTIMPVSSIEVNGSIVPPGTTLDYIGDGCWQKEVALDRQTESVFLNRTIWFTINGNSDLAIRRIPSTDTVALSTHGYKLENIRLNHGTYRITLDLRRHTFGIDAEVDPCRISVFGSSVANGQGATGLHGYAATLDSILADRYGSACSPYPFHTSVISINGNNSTDLIGRYEDVGRNFGKFVLLGISLGNEGLHDTDDKETVFNRFRDNMLSLIARLRADGKYPVVVNNYPRGDYNSADHTMIRRMNRLIHSWDLPSVNALGAIDDGAGRWPADYRDDSAHPNDAGHREFAYAFVPSLFDAITNGKELPKRDLSHDFILANGQTITFTPEGTMHPFTVSLRVKGTAAGKIISFVNAGNPRSTGTIRIHSDGKISYSSPSKAPIGTARPILNDGKWHHVTLSHYHAQGASYLYVDDKLIGKITERLVPTEFSFGDCDNLSTVRHLSEISIWRSALNDEEVADHTRGAIMKSSLELYSPLDVSDDGSIANRAQSLSSLCLHNRITYAVYYTDGNLNSNYRLECGKGLVRIIGRIPVKVTVTTLDGRHVRTASHLPPSTEIPLSPGLYIVNGRKVAIL
ncbi:MAG: GDSL-type esterase/lipase family protein [Staphylococcus sp.]|nr:GDSL-type esterase/lipase family protein [Staphylococcus sp.]